MLTRIVKMTFKPENIPSFERIFETSRPSIEAFPGCRLVRLHRDLKAPEVYFTYSLWDSEADLEHYRESDFFREVWGRTRVLFAQRAEAWSLEAVNPASETL